MAGPYQVHTSLPPGYVIPKQTTLEFSRGNHWAIPVQSLPFVPGASSSEHPDRYLSWLLPNYLRLKPSVFDDAVNAQCVRGYTHELQSRGGVFGDVTPREYANVSLMLVQSGFLVCHMLTSKDTDGDLRGRPVADWIARVQPYLDALLSAGAIDEACIGWEMNLLWDPTVLQPFKEWLRGYMPQRVLISSHFTSYVTAWQLPGHDRADYYNDGIVKKLKYQTDDTVNLGTMQAHFNDAMNPASGLMANNVALEWCEVKANSQFSGVPKGSDHPNEDDGDMYGFGGLCTPGSMFVNGGFGNGARYPDGSVI